MDTQFRIMGIGCGLFQMETQQTTLFFSSKQFSLPWIYIKSKPNHILKGLIPLSNYRYFFEEAMF